MSSNNGYHEDKNLILTSLDEIKENIKDLHKEVTELKVAQGKLETRSSILWGAVGGMVPALIGFLIAWAKKAF